MEHYPTRQVATTMSSRKTTQLVASVVNTQKITVIAIIVTAAHPSMTGVLESFSSSEHASAAVFSVETASQILVVQDYTIAGDYRRVCTVYFSNTTNTCTQTLRPRNAYVV
jgi:hypothetical protein